MRTCPGSQMQSCAQPASSSRSRNPAPVVLVKTADQRRIDREFAAGQRHVDPLAAAVAPAGEDAVHARVGEFLNLDRLGQCTDSNTTAAQMHLLRSPSVSYLPIRLDSPGEPPGLPPDPCGPSTAPPASSALPARARRPAAVTARGSRAAQARLRRARGREGCRVRAPPSQVTTPPAAEGARERGRSPSPGLHRAVSRRETRLRFALAVSPPSSFFRRHQALEPIAALHLHRPRPC